MYGFLSIKNIASNISSSLINGFLLILCTPIYIKYIGIEGYGYIALWQMMQMLILLADPGLSTSLTREIAKYNSEFKLRNILKTTEYVLIPILIIVIILMFYASPYIANNWISMEMNDNINRVKVLKLIIVSIIFQFLFNLYSSCLYGIEEIFIVNNIQIISNLFRYIGVILVLSIAPEIDYFLIWQILIGLFQVVYTKYIVNKKININNKKSDFEFSYLKLIYRYSLQIYISAILGIMISNVDKIAVTKYLNTNNLGRYNLAVSGAFIIQLFVLAITRVLYPKFTKAISENLELSKKLYYDACAIAGLIVIPISFFLLFFSDTVYYLWLGDIDKEIILTFKILLISMLFSGIASVSAAYQQAFGWANFHSYMLLFSLLIGSILLPVSIQYYGIIGATIVWAIHGLSDITFGVWYMHKKMNLKKLKKWYAEVFFIPTILCIPVLIILKYLFPLNINRYDNFIPMLVSVFSILTIIFTYVFLKYRIKNVK